uniref:Uncharacterized protein n=1 Tax=Anguilla anguilla TaxID=7936 RepID=A0A0E9W8J1_ANGAN
MNAEQIFQSQLTFPVIYQTSKTLKMKNILHYDSSSVPSGDGFANETNLKRNNQPALL